MLASNPNTYIIIILVTYTAFFLQPLVRTIRDAKRSFSMSTPNNELMTYDSLKVNYESRAEAHQI